MSANQPSLSADWLPYARRDWARARLLFREHDPEGAALHLQQAVEKYLKGWLLDRGWPLRKTHELDRLLDAARQYDPSLQPFRPLCERVSGYYLIERYPTSTPSNLDLEQVRQDFDEARLLILVLFPNEAVPT
jgi:HEPN domain-containing protein